MPANRTLGCDYEGPHFGAPYPDAICGDGYLWDLDSCEEPGGALFRGGDIPCPQCNLDAFVAYHAPDTWTGGNARQRRKYNRRQFRELRTRIMRKLGLNGSSHIRHPANTEGRE